MIVYKRKTHSQWLRNQINHRNQTFAIFTGKIGNQVLYGADRVVNTEFFDSDVQLLEDTHHQEPQYVYFFPESCIYEPLHKFIMDLHEFGIMKKLETSLGCEVSKKMHDPRKVLTFYMLSAGFYLWLSTVLIAFVVFVGEHIVYWLSNLVYKKMVDTFSIFYL